MQQLAYVNTDQPPLKVTIIGYLLRMPTSKVIEVITLEKRVYPHPEAPEYATISLITEGDNFEVHESEDDFGILYLEYRTRSLGREVVERRNSNG